MYAMPEFDYQLEIPVNPILCAWMADRQIVRFSLPNTQNDTVMHWVYQVKHMLKYWQPGKTWLALHDFSNGGMTPLARYWLGHFSEFIPTSSMGYCALVVPEQSFSKGKRLLAYVEQAALTSQVQRSFFFSEHRALEWLEQHIPTLA